MAVRKSDKQIRRERTRERERNRRLAEAKELTGFYKTQEYKYGPEELKRESPFSIVPGTAKGKRLAKKFGGGGMW